MPPKGDDAKEDKKEAPAKLDPKNGHHVVQTYGKMFLSQTPAAGFYNLPSQFDNTKKAHRYSFTAKPRPPSEGHQPPPPKKPSDGEKYPEPKFETSAPRFSMGGRTRRVDRDSTPGPGAYFYKKPLKEEPEKPFKTRGGLLTSRPRERKEWQPTVDKPPKFEPDEARLKTWASSPRWTHAGRPHRPASDDVVGPGAYFKTKEGPEGWPQLPLPPKNPGHAFTGKPYIKKDAFPADLRPPKPVDKDAPPEKFKSDRPKWTMTGRHPQHDTVFLNTQNANKLHLKPIPPPTPAPPPPPPIAASAPL